MKKLLTILALTLMTVVIALTVAGCGTDTSAVDNLADKVDELTNKVYELTNKVDELTERIEELEEKNNVFWTDKVEYSETETITVYFGKTAAFKIRLGDFEWSGKDGINNDFYLTSLCSDILQDSISFSTYLKWNSGTYLRASSTTNKIVKQNVETRVGGYYEGDETAYNNATYFDFVVCVPGTPFELARFKNVTVTK